MSKIYVFAIGGTGSRVLRSLTMLLASGVRTQNTIVPLIIDPDQANADLTRTASLLDRYARIHNALTFNSTEDNEFFGTEIQKDVDHYRMKIDNGGGKTFGSYLDDNAPAGGRSKGEEALIHMLFSNANLEANMTVGFKGNPNMGSVVLNQMEKSKEFGEFAKKFEQGDKIFIVSSIFGGTGASGFPSLFKTIRNWTGDNQEVLKNAVVGAISVLPYFDLKKNPDSAIDSGTFYSKTRAALEYYNRSMTNQGGVDHMYYIGDSSKQLYENSEGGATQRNKAHIVELIAALAILNFDKKSSDRNGESHTYEYGLENDINSGNSVTLPDLAEQTYKEIAAPLTQMMLAARLWQNTDSVLGLKGSKVLGVQPWSKDNKLDSQFFNSNFAQDVEQTLHDFTDWLQEMEKTFAPFNLSDGDPLNGVCGKEIKYGWFGKKGFEFLQDALNEERKVGGGKPEQALATLLYKATKRAVEKIKL